MASTIRLKTKIRDDVTTVRAIIRHPMETGFRIDDETGERIPEHYIKKIIAKHNSNIIFSCDWSRAVSKNPYHAYYLAPQKIKIGDKIEIAWFDTKDDTDSLEATIE